MIGVLYMIIEKISAEYIPQTIKLQQTILPFEVREDNLSERCRQMTEDPDYLLLIAREGDEVLGTATGICCRTLFTPFMVVEDVVVKENLRGRGIGKALMGELDRFAAEHGCGYAVLVSSGFRTQAHAFYEKVGYIEDVRGFRKGYAE